MDKLKADHVYEAAKYINKLSEIPPKRGLRTWAVPVAGINYPPKFLMSVALQLSGDNKEISSGKEFITDEAVRKFKELGFKSMKIKK